MKLALITGASSGIGADAARHLAKAGYRVILVARRRPELERVAQDIGENAVVEPCDAASGEQVLALADRVLRERGVPDVIVNAAGAGMWKFIEDTTPAEAVSMMNAPYFAAFNITHAFMTSMLERGSGTVIHINSPAAYFPWPSTVGYTAAPGRCAACTRRFARTSPGRACEAARSSLVKFRAPTSITTRAREPSFPWSPGRFGNYPPTNVGA